MKLNCLDSIFIPHKDETPHLLIVLHGRGDSYHGFTWLPQHLKLPINYLMVNAPDDYYGGYSWYDLEPNQLPGVQRSIGILEKLMAEVIDAGYKPEQCAILGFSQGCLMSFEWGGRTHHPLAGIVAISGFILDPEKLIQETSDVGKQIPRFVSHGTQDDVLSFDRSFQQVQQLKQAGYNLNFHSYNKAHSIDPRKEIRDITDFLKQVFKL